MELPAARARAAAAAPADSRAMALAILSRMEAPQPPSRQLSKEKCVDLLMRSALESRAAVTQLIGQSASPDVGLVSQRDAECVQQHLANAVYEHQTPFRWKMDEWLAQFGVSDHHDTIAVHPCVLGTGSAELDAYLQLESWHWTHGSLVEVCGEAGAGKTQLGMCLALHSASASASKGMALILYSRKSFPSARLAQLAACSTPDVSVDPRTVWVEVVAHVHELIDKISRPSYWQQLRAMNVRVILVDDIASLFVDWRPETSAPAGADRTTSKRHERERWELRAAVAHALKQCAMHARAVLVVVNQVVHVPTELGGFSERNDGAGSKLRNEIHARRSAILRRGSMVPALGASWAHFVDIRIVLHRVRSTSTRTIQLQKTCFSERAERACMFVIEAGGLRVVPDADEDTTFECSGIDAEHENEDMIGAFGAVDEADGFVTNVASNGEGTFATCWDEYDENDIDAEIDMGEERHSEEGDKTARSPRDERQPSAAFFQSQIAHTLSSVDERTIQTTAAVHPRSKILAAGSTLPHASHEHHSQEELFTYSDRDDPKRPKHHCSDNPTHN
ncbi:DNA repair protein XRCC3-like [Porphyridium purpureum]|uniref:DNA repair protein XRCC3-like n=1 Tax=Porphyridium purpureum TaxID=35688 RepID=A0A5J4YJE8_PORPP|nr:DNA repair protein XRCC3-like [Porphyridium purpureum]|eukprot:POR9498..scf210_14